MPNTEEARNPTWSRDELILTLDLYVQFQGNPPGKTSKNILEISDLLNKMGATIANRKKDFRNPNGVYMKVMNFRRFDPTYISQGKKGLQRGGKLEEDVWHDFAIDPHRLSETANAIRLIVIKGDVPEASEEEDEEFAEAEEGRILTRIHRSRERSRKLVENKKASVLKANGHLKCEACSFDFEATYGKRGKGFIEAHHVNPVHTLVAGQKTKLEDLVLLCSNCHRIVHTQRPWLTVDELHQLFKD
jgi:5-methylcytosine-specific restriction protein A